MKKIIFLLLIILISINTVGCTKMIYSSSSNSIEAEKAEVLDIAEKIIQFIENDDSDALKELFSDNVTADLDYDVGYQYTVGLYKGNMKSISDRGTHIGGSLGSKKCKTAYARYDITTTDNEYSLWFVYVMKSNVEGDVGIKRVKLLKKGDTTGPRTQLYEIYYKQFGVFNPEWDTEYLADPEKWEY